MNKCGGCKDEQINTNTELEMKPKSNEQEELIGLVDLDYVKYSVASVGEERYIMVWNPETKVGRKFPNRTEFWGRSKKPGGALGEWLGLLGIECKDKKQEYSFLEIEDVQEQKEPLQNILHSAKEKVNADVKASGATTAKYFVGKGDSFRVQLSTLLEYKGNRKDSQKPLLLDDVMNYLTKTFRADVITDIEVDDKLVMEYIRLAKEGKKCVIIGVDKDYKTAPVHVFNPDKPLEGIIDCTGFGEIRREGDNVRGHGRLFKYWQILSQDDSDNYKANCFSDVSWGNISAFNVLVDCKNDKQALQALVDSYKNLYPEPKVITGWRGNEAQIDWMYVLQEIWDMSHLQRWEGDRVLVKSVLDKLKINY